MTNSQELENKITEWLEWDKNEMTRAAIKKFSDEKNYEHLAKVLLNRLKFGTAGLRGKMEAGYNCMNDLVIIQTGQGLLRYLENYEKNLLVENGVVIGYDGRHNSRRWAELTATIFVQAGYKARLFSDLVPTPFVPFSVKKYGSAIGVVVTASHNPKDDNGYKVYGSNATQIVTPSDKNIQNEILNNLEPWPTSWDTEILKNNELLIDPLDEVVADYVKYIRKTILPGHVTINEKVRCKFVYTPVHGVGYRYVQKMLDSIGINFDAVPEQKDPHPDFPTVEFPNPEEGASCLDLSFKLADQNNCTIVLANDPDADRLACAEKDIKTGKWKIFSGNELGALLGWWLLKCYKLKHPHESLDKVYMMSSTVSSMILRSMAKKEGFNFVDTLTGFKWMGNKSVELVKEGYEVIFAFEEAIGYMCGTKVLDKDGVSAACHLASMASFLRLENKTLSDQLEEIYSIYGYHVSLNSYYICYYGHVIKRIFERIRNFHAPNSYPTEVLNGKYKIKNVRDLTTGYDNNQDDHKAILPVDPSSEMITFTFTNGLVCTLRTSGTEPKIKYYTEMCATPEQTDRSAIIKTLKEEVDAVIEELFQPKENDLIPRSS